MEDVATPSFVNKSAEKALATMADAYAMAPTVPDLLAATLLARHHDIVEQIERDKLEELRKQTEALQDLALSSELMRPTGKEEARIERALRAIEQAVYNTAPR